jgi:hypothetical protein
MLKLFGPHKNKGRGTIFLVFIGFTIISCLGKRVFRFIQSLYSGDSEDIKVLFEVVQRDLFCFKSIKGMLSTFHYNYGINYLLLR